MKKVSLKSLSLIWLSILLTAVNVFGQGPTPERRASVRAAFEEFHSLLNFLAGSNPFLSQLTPEERNQFMLVGNTIVKRGFRMGAGPVVAGTDKTSNLVPFSLKFSSDNADFDLHDGQPPRSAKVTEDVWFNLNVVNDPKTQFNLLDTFQILFHEFGHKLIEQKDQALIDQVATKVRAYLLPYYRETEMAPGMKGISLVLPYLMVAEGVVDYQFEPVLLVDYQDQVAQLKTEVRSLLLGTEGFTSVDPSVQTFKRIELTPALHLYQDKLMVAWTVGTKDVLIDKFRFNYVDLYTNFEKTLADQAVPAIRSEKLVYQTIPQSQIFQAGGALGQLKNFFQGDTDYPSAVEQKWIDNLKLVGSAQDDVFLEGSIESPVPLQEVSLKSQIKNDTFDFPAHIEAIGNNQYKIRFQVPRKSNRAGKLYFLSLSVNGQERWDLPERLNVDTEVVPGMAIGRPREIQIWDGSQWQKADEIKTPSLETDQIKIRMIFPAGVANLDHVEMTWAIQAGVWKNGQKVALRSTQISEVIPRENLVQQRDATGLSVEFASQKTSSPSADVAGKDSFVIRGTPQRGLVNMQYADMNLNVAATGVKLTDRLFKSVFVLRPAIKSSPRSCSELF